MIATCHIVVGAAIGTALHRPWLAWPAAYASHFLLDRLPHLDPHALVGVPNGRPTRREVAWGAVDTLVGTALGLWLAWGRPEYRVMVGAAFFAVLPDLMCFPWLDWRRVWSPVVWLRGLHQLAHCAIRPGDRLVGFGTGVAALLASVGVIHFMSP